MGNRSGSALRKGSCNEPFLVINADDYYGKEGFKKIHDYMVNEMDPDADPYDMCMGGFILENTLSDNGTVTRGVCEVNPDGTLKDVTRPSRFSGRMACLVQLTARAMQLP